MAYADLNENYLNARSICLELLYVVRNNKSVYRKQRIGVVYDHLSRCEFYLGHTEKKAEEKIAHFLHATEYARQAQEHFTLNSENYCIALEQEFYALFAMKQYEQAVDVANKMISSATQKELGEFRFSKYNYLIANALFKQRRFPEALQLLSQNREIAKDKSGWETGARVLKIMTLIEMFKLDEASLAVCGLKQFFTRIEMKVKQKETPYNSSSPGEPLKKETTTTSEREPSPIRHRDKKILNLLLVAENNGFMFTTLNGNTDKYMNALTSKEKKLRWEPFTHELIPFHEWFAGKMKKKIETSGEQSVKKQAKKFAVVKAAH